MCIVASFIMRCLSSHLFLLSLCIRNKHLMFPYTYAHTLTLEFIYQSFVVTICKIVHKKCQLIRQSKCEANQLLTTFLWFLSLTMLRIKKIIALGLQLISFIHSMCLCYWYAYYTFLWWMNLHCAHTHTWFSLYSQMNGNA